jgi:hypothetical protein
MNLLAPQNNQKKLVSIIEHDILFSLYKENTDVAQATLNEKIKSVYKEIFSINFNPQQIKNLPVLPLFLLGITPEDNTTLYIETSLKICHKLQLNLLLNPSENSVFTKNDYIIIDQNCAKLPTINNLNLKTTPQFINDNIQQAAGSLLLFTNFEFINDNSPIVVKTIENKRANTSQMQNTVIGISSTLINPKIPPAFVTRARIFILEKPTKEHTLDNIKKIRESNCEHSSNNIVNKV